MLRQGRRLPCFVAGRNGGGNGSWADLWGWRQASEDRRATVWGGVQQRGRHGLWWLQGIVLLGTPQQTIRCIGRTGAAAEETRTLTLDVGGAKQRARVRGLIVAAEEAAPGGCPEERPWLLLLLLGVAAERARALVLLVLIAGRAAKEVASRIRRRAENATGGWSWLVAEERSATLVARAAEKIAARGLLIALIAPKE